MTPWATKRNSYIHHEGKPRWNNQAQTICALAVVIAHHGSSKSVKISRKYHSSAPPQHLRRIRDPSKYLQTGDIVPIPKPSHDHRL